MPTGYDALEGQDFLYADDAGGTSSATYVEDGPVASQGEMSDDRQTEIKLVDRSTDREWDQKRPIYINKKWAIDIAIKPPEEIAGLLAPDGRESIKKPVFLDAINILVKITDASDGPVQMQIDDPFRTMVLPPRGPSKTYRVPFTPVLKKPEEVHEAAAWEGKLNVQLFYRLNLIDAVEVNLKVIEFARAGDALLPPASQAPVHFIRYQKEKDSEGRPLGWLGDDVLPREMVVYIATDDKKVSLDFTIVRTGANPIRLSAVSFVPHAELAVLLIDFREVMTKLILDSFDGNAVGSESICNAALLELAKTGNRAWRLLFENNAASESLSAIGNYLKSLRLSDRSAIQIVLRDTIADFVFPWPILYDGEYPSAANPAEWRNFWGARYQIEQIVDFRRSVRSLAPESVSYAFLPWDAFPEAKLVRERLDGMKSLATVQSLGEVKTQAQLIAAIKDDLVNFYCFFCHGHTRAPTDPVFENFLKKQYKTLTDIEQILTLQTDPETQARCAALKQYVVAIRAMLRSNMNATDHTINLTDEIVKYQEFVGVLGSARFESQPIVFLDICQSAQFFPGMFENFVALFLKLRAATVIGTECEISPALGECFARSFVDQLVRNGSTAGEALLDARNSLFSQKNPLGLVFTLYGRGNRSLVPKPLPAAEQKELTNVDEH